MIKAISLNNYNLTVLKTVDPNQQACAKLADQNLIFHSVKIWNPLTLCIQETPK